MDFFLNNKEVIKEKNPKYGSFVPYSKVLRRLHSPVYALGLRINIYIFIRKGGGRWLELS